MGTISDPGGKDFLVLTAKNFLVWRNFRREGVPGEMEFPTGKISWWEGVPGRKHFLARRSSRQERFPGGKEFPAGKISW